MCRPDPHSLQNPLPDGERPKATLDICDFSETPSQTFVQGGNIVVPFKPPEKIKLESISIVMKRNSQIGKGLRRQRFT